MARMYPLFSSSSGNCTYIGDEKSGILVDAGVSCKKICTALENAGIGTSAVRAVLVLEILAEKDKVCEGCVMEELGSDTVDIGGFGVTAFRTPHDTPVSCGYRITVPGGADCAVCTDLGVVTDDIHEQLKKCRLVLLESNYDPKMLKYGPYPEELKERIASERGHLSNGDCGRELIRLVKAGVYSFVLGHISQHNNTPELAENSAVRALCGYERGEDYLLTAAKPEGTGRAVVF